MNLWQMLEKMKSNQYKWVDLSYAVDKDTPHYKDFRDLEIEDVMTFDKEKVSAREYTMVSQFGTHVDPPSHFIQNGRTLDKIGLKEMIYPLCVIDVSQEVAKNPDFGLEVEHIKKWEAKHGEIPEGCFVAMRTDWYKREGEDFFNEDENGDPHYPGWTIDALKYLCEERNIAAIGHEPPDTDPAVNNKIDLWAAELYYLKQDKYQAEILRQLDQLPAKGALMFCVFPAVVDAPGFTSRCFAIAPNE